MSRGPIVGAIERLRSAAEENSALQAREAVEQITQQLVANHHENEIYKGFGGNMYTLALMLESEPADARWVALANAIVTLCAKTIKTQAQPTADTIQTQAASTKKPTRFRRMLALLGLATLAATPQPIGTPLEKSIIHEPVTVNAPALSRMVDPAVIPHYPGMEQNSWEIVGQIGEGVASYYGTVGDTKDGFGYWQGELAADAARGDKHAFFEQVNLARDRGEEVRVFSANGEIFDPRIISCAMNGKYLNEHVLVINTKNNKKILAKVTDTGAFEEKYHRLIDCSYAGAKALAYIDAGTATVKVFLLKKIPTPPTNEFRSAD